MAKLCEHLILMLFACVISFQFVASDDVGSPLFLTPLVRSGSIEKARELSKVGKLPNTTVYVESYSGYITVNQTYGSNMFFWFVPAVHKVKGTPVILWMQGGPGDPSLIGFFVEHGPYTINENLTASLREHYWSKHFNVIYLDNPVGTGFSFTNDDRGYITNQEDMADNVYEFLQQFFTIFYEYRESDFYVAGESYGGKYAPSVAYKIHTIGPSSKINMKGVAISGGFSDPISFINYGTHLYELGLIDAHQDSRIKTYEKTVKNHIHKKEYKQSLIEYSNMLDYVTNITGYTYFYNILQSDEPKYTVYYAKYVDLPQVRKAAHIGEQIFETIGTKVREKLSTDFMKSVKGKVEILMDNYKVLYYNGHLDIIVVYPNTLNFLNSLNWKYAENYRFAPRKIWRLSGKDDVAGYVKNVGDFYQVVVRGAGHLLSNDKPEEGLDLITRFICGTSFT